MQGFLAFFLDVIYIVTYIIKEKLLGITEADF